VFDVVSNNKVDYRVQYVTVLSYLHSLPVAEVSRESSLKNAGTYYHNSNKIYTQSEKFRAWIAEKFC
jgi:hypothetical protein